MIVSDLKNRSMITPKKVTWPRIFPSLHLFSAASRERNQPISAPTLYWHSPMWKSNMVMGYFWTTSKVFPCESCNSRNLDRNREFYDQVCIWNKISNRHVHVRVLVWNYYWQDQFVLFIREYQQKHVHTFRTFYPTLTALSICGAAKQELETDKVRKYVLSRGTETGTYI